MPLLRRYLCYWSCRYFINIYPLWYSFLTQQENSLAVTLQRRQMGCLCHVCSVLEKGQGTKLDESLQWPAGPSQLPFFLWEWSSSDWKHNCHGIKTDTLIVRQVGCRELVTSHWVFVCHSPRWDEYLLYNNPLEICDVTWRSWSVCPAWFIQVTWSLLSKGKASLNVSCSPK